MTESQQHDHNVTPRVTSRNFSWATRLDVRIFEQSARQVGSISGLYSTYCCSISVFEAAEHGLDGACSPKKKSHVGGQDAVMIIVDVARIGQVKYLVGQDAVDAT